MQHRVTGGIGQVLPRHLRLNRTPKVTDCDVRASLYAKVLRFATSAAELTTNSTMSNICALDSPTAAFLFMRSAMSVSARD